MYKTWIKKGEKHKTYQRFRSWTPDWKIRIYWTGSIEEPNAHIMVFFYRLYLLIKTPDFIRRFMRWRENLRIYRQNKFMGVCCPECGSYKMLVTHGFAYEPIGYCKKCGYMEPLYDDITPYII